MDEKLNFKFKKFYFFKLNHLNQKNILIRINYLFY